MSDARGPLPVDDYGPDDLTDEDWARADGPDQFYERLRKRPDQWDQVQKSLAEISEHIHTQPASSDTKALTSS